MTTGGSYGWTSSAFSDRVCRLALLDADSALFTLADLGATLTLTDEGVPHLVLTDAGPTLTLENIP